jgi:phosphoglycolate phosphatase
MALIVFDLDGTLIDSRKDLAHSANALIRERGGTELPEEAIGRMVGDGAAALVRRALTAAGLPVDETGLQRFLELYDAHLLRTTRPYSGIEDALKPIQQFGPLAVLTNKPLEPTRKLLTALCLQQFFVTVMGGDGAFPRKPNPHGLQHLMAMHGTESQNTILVGDSQIDAATARAARTAFCLATYGFGVPDPPPAADATVAAPAELPSAIRRLLA